MNWWIIGATLWSVGAWIAWALVRVGSSGGDMNEWDKAFIEEREKAGLSWEEVAEYMSNSREKVTESMEWLWADRNER